MAYTTIDKPTDYFESLIYDGTSGAQSITGLDFTPDWVWLKSRSNAGFQWSTDSVRGATKTLHQNNANAEGTESGGLTSFNSGGFSIGTNTDINGSSKTFCSWNWKGGTTASGTTNGSKPYSYSASPDAGFSVVTYTGNATAGHLIPHGMGKVPRLIHIKSRGDDNGWTSGTIASASAWNDHGYLHLTNAFGTDANQFGATPDATNFRLGTGTGTNGNNGTRVAYCFADVKGYQKINKYVGSGNADGQYIHLGFKPAFLIIKNFASGEGWLMFDNKRLGYNFKNESFYANSNAVEASGSYVDLLSNGFKARSTNGVINGSGATYLYHAIAESPFVNSSGVPNNAR